jgi:hypothetical protein
MRKGCKQPELRTQKGVALLLSFLFSNRGLIDVWLRLLFCANSAYIAENSPVNKDSTGIVFCPLTENVQERLELDENSWG